MNPIAQKLLGMGALMGFTLTFLSGSPVMDDAMGVVLRSIAGGAIFGSLGYIAGLLVNQFISERVEVETKAYLLKKELKRQTKLQKVQEAKDNAAKRDDSPELLNDDLMVGAAFGLGEVAARGA